MTPKQYSSALMLAMTLAVTTPAHAFFGWFKSEAARVATEAASDISAGKRLAGTLKDLPAPDLRALCADVLRGEAAEIALYAGRAETFEDWIQARETEVLTLRSALLFGQCAGAPPARLLAEWSRMGEGSGDWWFVRETVLSLCRAQADRETLGVLEQDRLMRQAREEFGAMEGAERLFRLKRQTLPSGPEMRDAPECAPTGGSHFSGPPLADVPPDEESTAEEEQ